MNEQEQREAIREFAKKNLATSNLVDIYTNQLSRTYGEEGARIIGNHVYENALDSEIKYQDIETGQEKTLIGKSVGETLKSYRKDGKIGTGNISEQQIINTANATIERSINYLNVEDFTEALGISGKLKQEYKGKMLVELMPQEITEEQRQEMKVREFEKLKEQENFYKSLIQSYKIKLLNKRMKQAMEGSEKENSKNLEKILMEEKK